MSLTDNVIGISAIFGAAAVGALVIGAGLAQTGLNPIMTDYDGAVKTVEQAGFSDVEATGYGWFACGIGEDAEWWRTSFEAKNANGQDVSGVVCSSILKGDTIRFD